MEVRLNEMKKTVLDSGIVPRRKPFLVLLLRFSYILQLYVLLLVKLDFLASCTVIFYFW